MKKTHNNREIVLILKSDLFTLLVMDEKTLSIKDQK